MASPMSTLCMTQSAARSRGNAPPSSIQRGLPLLCIQRGHLWENGLKLTLWKITLTLTLNGGMLFLVAETAQTRVTSPLLSRGQRANLFKPLSGNNPLWSMDSCDSCLIHVPNVTWDKAVAMHNCLQVVMKCSHILSGTARSLSKACCLWLVD